MNASASASTRRCSGSESGREAGKIQRRPSGGSWSNETCGTWLLYRGNAHPPLFRHVPVASGDQPCTPPEREVRPGPLGDNEQAVLEAGQVINMDDEPKQTRGKASKLEGADFEDGAAPADSGHLALVDK